MSISQKVCWRKSLKWWVVCRMNAIDIKISICYPIFVANFSRHWFFSRWKVCWRLELTVVILSVPSTTKGWTAYQWGWSQLFGSSIWLDFVCLSMSLMTHASKHLHTHAHCHPHIGTYAHRQFKQDLCASVGSSFCTHTHIHTHKDPWYVSNEKTLKPGCLGYIDLYRGLYAPSI